jgi:hypothetical protein
MQEIRNKIMRIMNLIFPKYNNNKNLKKIKSNKNGKKRNKFGFPQDLEDKWR